MGMKKTLSRMIRGFALLLCCVCVGIASLYAYTHYQEYEELKLVEADILKRIEEEKLAQDQLEFEMEYSMTDSYVEKIARERLGLVKSTDIRFVIDNE